MADSSASATIVHGRRAHVLTIAVEDYFQAAALGNVVHQRQWSRFERRVQKNTRTALDLLDDCGSGATFFMQGWIAREMPELAAEIVARGHEVASKGHLHRFLREMTPEEFREDLRRSREEIERASGVRVLGYRVPRGSFGSRDLWALDILAEEGFAYDSSIYPFLRSIGREPWRRFPFQHRAGEHVLWEMPLTSLRVAGLSIPCGGGNYFRQLPHEFGRAALRHFDQTQKAPIVLHFHVWELDPELPSITAAGVFAQLRMHRNIAEMPERIRDHLESFSFVGVADHLGLAREKIPELQAAPPSRRIPSIETSKVPPEPVTVVVPCYNEELVLPYLANTLEEVTRSLSAAYDLKFVFVDDGSTDETWSQLVSLFGSRPDCKLVQQPRNMGVAAAILAGVRASTTEMVCSIDCDCTYDPQQLQGMIPLFQDGVDLVTASPYHPQGAVMNVPAWRLGLSKGLSKMYGVVLGEKLATYTSCFRVYRRSAFADLQLRESGFLGVAEMIGVLSMRRARIVEYPAVLEVRMLGRSKMKIVRTILGHLRLLARFTGARLERRWSASLVHHKQAA
ncbi:MAG: glycosyltransferase [Deltaproteobacteria bacterium]|nr:glycosyltransferase [Deltaproteobacteria bacterium]